MNKEQRIFILYLIAYMVNGFLLISISMQAMILQLYNQSILLALVYITLITGLIILFWGCVPMGSMLRSAFPNMIIDNGYVNEKAMIWEQTIISHYNLKILWGWTTFMLLWMITFSDMKYIPTLLEFTGLALIVWVIPIGYYEFKADYCTHSFPNNNKEGEP